jgi:ferredoxin
VSILITIDQNKCRGPWFCEVKCSHELAQQCEQGLGEVVVEHNWSLPYAREVESRCPDKAINVRLIG